MALDATQNDRAVINVLIDDIERDLGPLAQKVFSAPLAEAPATLKEPAARPKVAAGHHVNDIKAVLNAAGGLADDLMTLVEDGVLELTDTLVTLIADLLELERVAKIKLGTFTPGNSISESDLDSLDNLFEGFGELLKTARESTVTVKATPSEEEVEATDAETSDAETSEGGGSDTDQPVQARTVTEDEEEETTETVVEVADTTEDGDGDGETPPVLKSDTDEGEAVDGSKDGEEVEETEEAEVASGPTLTEVVLAGQAALDEIDAFTDELLTLYFGYKDIESPQLVDGFDWQGMRQEMLSELEGLRSNLVAALESGDKSPQDMMDMIDATMAVVVERMELVDAVKLTMFDGPDAEGTTPRRNEEDLHVRSLEEGSDEAAPEGKSGEDEDSVEGAQDTESVDEPEVPPGPTMAEVVVAGQEALDEMDAIIDDLMGLYFEFKDTERPQLSDSIDWRGMRQEIIGDLESLRSDLVAALESGDTPPQEMMDMIDTTMAKVAVKVDMIEAVKLTMGDTTGDETEVTPRSAEGEPAEEAVVTEPTRKEVAAAAQALLNRFDALSDEALEFYFEYASIDDTRLFDGVDWQNFKAGIDSNTEALMGLVSAAIQDPNADLGAVMRQITEMSKVADDMTDYMEVMGDSIEAGEPETKAGAATESTEVAPLERAEVVDAAEDLFDRVDTLKDTLTSLYFKAVNIHNPELADSMDWMAIKGEISALADDVRDKVNVLLFGPDQDLEKAMAIIAEASTTIQNYEDLTAAVGGFGLVKPKGAEAAPEVNWNSFQPKTRTDVVFATQDLLAMANRFAGYGLEMFMQFKDYENPRLSDQAPWMEYRAEAQGIIDEIKERMPELLAGDKSVGGMTDEQLDAARDFLLEQKGKLEDLSGKMDVWTTLPTLAVDQGRIWGDPHFVGEDGGQYDVQGVAGQHYNILSDAGLQVNARFDEFGHAGSGMTVMGAIGITIGNDQIEINKDGRVLINGEAVSSGTYLDGKVTVTEGRHVQIKEEEYSFRVDFQKHSGGDHLNIENIRSDNAAADGVLPSGLWGVTVDYDDDARNGDAGKGTQGGGAIEDLEGNITERGDRTTVQDYEVNGLFQTDFEHHNRFDG